VISGAERLQSFHCRRPVRDALCDIRIQIVGVETVRGPTRLATVAVRHDRFGAV